VSRDPREDTASGRDRRSRGTHDVGPVGVEGTVIETLPHGLFRVTIERQRQVTAHVPSGPGRNFIRVLVGDRVRLELSTRDLTRGRIVEKLS
jgi:translation initiation factor IF-1